ncbi:lysylphosphatidylglycerol synthase transmembrane domain-containing protein [Ochrovirga pacifica]|uniref:lysylphosphatidylglycerol synthase transmembrane domain-containing protein n=1 Tax=Ochrovirga pacifica TaxID=1042376 RepID=UPI000255A4E0|nr:lysylphosphatidylglycerol synthase transmembrane domain-containing protein [Ochrovirga pacifica]
MKAKSIKKTAITALKIGVSVLLFYFVVTKIDFLEVLKNIKESNMGLLVLSGVFLLLSQVVSSYRLNVFFHTLGYKLSHKSNHILYLVGMFYNFFIPGGIGGDAYKIYLLNKEFGWKVKKLSAAAFVDRFSGLTAIGMLLVLLMIPFVQNLGWFESYLVLYGLGVVLISFVPLIAFVFIQKLFGSFKTVFFKTLGYSLVIQLLQLASVACLVANFQVLQDLFSYLLVFLISVVLSIVSFAGIGVREFVFYQAADFLQYDKDISVAIGLLFTFLTALISIIGVWFLIKKATLRLVDH